MCSNVHHAMSFNSCNKVLEKRWQLLTYEKHRQRLREMQSRIKSKNTERRGDEELKLQMRLRRELAEGHRQSVIDQQNLKLLSRIAAIMTKPRNTYFDAREQHKDRKRKGSRKHVQEFEKNAQPARGEGETHLKGPSKLPPISQALCQSK